MREAALRRGLPRRHALLAAPRHAALRRGPRRGRRAAGLGRAVDRRHRHAGVLGQAGRHADRHGHRRGRYRRRQGPASTPSRSCCWASPKSALIKFNNQYVGKFVGDKIEIGPPRPDESIIGVDAITGATVTVIAQNQVMSAARARRSAARLGILEPVNREPRAQAQAAAPLELGRTGRREGCVKPLTRDAARGRAGRRRRHAVHRTLVRLPEPPRRSAPASSATAGYARLHSQLAAGEHAIFVVRCAGRESFKGSGFVRGGIYDRIQVAQGHDAFTFRDLDYAQPLRHRGRRRAGVRRVGDLHRPLERVLGRLSVEAGLPRQPRRPRRPAQRSFAQLRRPSYWLRPPSCSRAAAPTSPSADAPWLPRLEARKR
ncbi:MAG: hypothetical protein MZW92_74670 [Comamonadaceae bacterium]|nr:hypothetical protein [Comamonadaceae bacterium]